MVKGHFRERTKWPAGKAAEFYLYHCTIAIQCMFQQLETVCPHMTVFLFACFSVLIDYLIPQDYFSGSFKWIT